MYEHLGVIFLTNSSWVYFFKSSSPPQIHWVTCLKAMHFISAIFGLEKRRASVMHAKANRKNFSHLLSWTLEVKIQLEIFGYHVEWSAKIHVIDHNNIGNAMIMIIWVIWSYLHELHIVIVESTIPWFETWPCCWIWTVDLLIFELMISVSLVFQHHDWSIRWWWICKMNKHSNAQVRFFYRGCILHEFNAM